MLIKVRKLSAFYESNQIFKDISFDVVTGDYLCIVGENGSGKTTLMRTLLGFDIKHTGEIELVGVAKNKIGWLPQRTEGKKDFPASVKEVILSGLGGKKLLGLGYGKALCKKAADMIELVGIKTLLKRSFSTLSGGQQQKVLLCRALCATDGILLLDEPTAGLDFESQEEMYSIIRRLNNNGITIIMITHDIERATSEAKHILSISENDYFYGTNAEFASYYGGDV